MTSLTTNYLSEDVSIRSIEKGYLSQALSLCLILLKFVIESKRSTQNFERPVVNGMENLRHKGQRVRKYLSLFGMLEFSRISYHSTEGGMLFPLDESLGLPADLWSYNLQELVGGNASETNFRESVRILNSLLGLNLTGTGSERGIHRLGENVEAYYSAKEVVTPSGLVHFSASFDGKGVPKIKPKNKDNSTKFVRLGKGEKRGIKQMATVGVMSWFEPKNRTAADVLNGLMGKEEEKQSNKEITPKSKNDNQWHQGIHRRAFLADQNKCLDYGMKHIKSLITNPESRFVVPIDAGIGLEEAVLKHVKKYELEAHFDGIILDIIHVSEYVWSCANAVLGEQSKLRTDWVREVLKDLLDSQTQKVIDDLKKIVQKGGLSDSKNTTIGKTITYFTNHCHKMDYQSFIEKGYPVSSALVESNCRHLVKDRMEQSGMRWSSQGAQNMMDVRAVKLNGDLVDFIDFVEKKNKKMAA